MMENTNENKGQSMKWGVAKKKNNNIISALIAPSLLYPDGYEFTRIYSQDILLENIYTAKSYLEKLEEDAIALPEPYLRSKLKKQATMYRRRKND